MTQYTYISRSWQLGSDVREIFDYEGWEPELVGSGVPPGLSCTTYYWDQIDIGRITISGVPSQVGTYTFDVLGWGDTPDPQVKRFTVTIWQPSYTHTIYYNANGGSGSMGATTVTDYNSGNSNVTSAANGFTAPTGKYFTGWNTAADGTGTSYASGAQVPVAGNSSITLYAQWTYYTYTVTWKNWDGTVLETDYNVQYGTTPSYNSATPTRATDAQYVYTFSGWSPAVGAITGATTYTAQFSTTLRNYAITVNIDSSANYGSISPTTVANKDYGSSYSVSGTVLTVGGTAVTATASTATTQYTYGFDGWYIGNTKITSAGSITGATTFTAKFTRTLNQYVITVTADSHGSVTGGGTYNYGASATLTATADTDYVFEKWQDNNTDNPRTVTVTGAATYTAYFVEKLPPIGVKVNGDWVQASAVWVKAPTNANLISTLEGYTNTQLSSRTVGEMTSGWQKATKVWIKVNGEWKESS